jgi:hypothetical protein
MQIIALFFLHFLHIYSLYFLHNIYIFVIYLTMVQNNNVLIMEVI